MDEACCTCATLLRHILPQYDEQTEKPKALDRRSECCGRVICGNCIANNERFATYCPFCQVSTKPSPLPQGLRDPPSYVPASQTSTSSQPVTKEPTTEPPAYADELPSYSSLSTPTQLPSDSKASASDTEPTQDVLHFLHHPHDTLTSLSFRYQVPLPALRRANNLTSDHLLIARRAIIIPGEYYKGGVSLSPRPVEGEEEERRKATVRRWMVACKVSDYEIALLYLEQAEYDLAEAIGVYQDDERWERENPLQGEGVNGDLKGKGKRVASIARRRFTGQKP